MDRFMLPIDSEQIPEEGSRVPAVVPSHSKRLIAAFGFAIPFMGLQCGTGRSGRGKVLRSTTSSISSPETPVWENRCELRLLNVKNDKHHALAVR